MNDDSMQSFVRGFINDRAKLKSCSFVRAASLILDEYPQFSSQIHSLIEEHNANADESYERSSENELVSTRDRRESGFKAWYFPEDPGPAWQHFRQRAIENGLEHVIDDIDEQSTAIVQRIANPDVKDDKRKGLVLGYVQSGKTANYSAVIAKAVDEGYRFIIVLAGMFNNLRNQTQQRLMRDLGIGNNTESDILWHTLTDLNEDMSSKDRKNATSILLNGNTVIAVVKKNSRVLTHLLKFLDAAGDSVTQDITTLIIDDESDQASPDASARIGDDPTAINKLIRKIWSKFKHGTYIGYTATPFANVLINPDDSRVPGLPDLYPSDFIYPLPRPKGYLGAEELFGIDPDDPGLVREDESFEASVVRSIPQEDADALRAPSDIDEYQPVLPETLKRSIKWFLIATAARRMRDKQSKHSTMLVHVSHRVQVHRQLANEITKYLKQLNEPILDGNTDAFRTLFDEEIGRAASLYSGNGEAVTWSNIQDRLIDAVRSVQVKIDNSEAEDHERLDYDNIDVATFIVVGGGTLSRGLTLEGLITSFFMRETPNYDTLIQMGRWFGFRNGYEDLQRIWVTNQLRSDYRFLAGVEADLRREITDHIKQGLKPSDLGPAIVRHPGRLQITATNKMKWAVATNPTFDGKVLQTTRFNLDDDATFHKNFVTTVEFLREIAPYYVSEGTSRFGQCTATGVPLEAVEKFLTRFTFHEHFESSFEEALKWARERADHRLWNVRIVHGEREDFTFPGTDITVRMVNRSPLDLESSTMDIRALTSAGDRYSDLEREPTGESEYERLRQRFNAGGNGLLIVYPISKTSAPSSRGQKTRGNSQLRTSMRDLLHKTKPHSVSGDALKEPLIGVAAVLPVTQRGLDEFGGKVRVQQPAFEESEG